MIWLFVFIWTQGLQYSYNIILKIINWFRRVHSSTGDGMSWGFNPGSFSKLYINVGMLSLFSGHIDTGPHYNKLGWVFLKKWDYLNFWEVVGGRQSLISAASGGNLTIRGILNLEFTSPECDIVWLLIRQFYVFLILIYSSFLNLEISTILIPKFSSLLNTEFTAPLILIFSGLQKSKMLCDNEIRNGGDKQTVCQ